MSDEILFNESLMETHLAVDVRTPLEFDEDHISGAINVPLLSNEERAEIGTIHKTEGPHPARVRGLEMVAHKLPALVAAIADQAGGRPVLVYCWRGGLRSRTVTSVLTLTGYRAFQLKGGYKSFRQHVIDYFLPFKPPAPLVVIHGMTGIGKTSFIVGLKKEHFTVIDLEGLACHRGSAFGELGLEQKVSQKRFETLLWDEFRSAPTGKPIIVEGESKRIGKLYLPGEMYEVMQMSRKIWCEASLETRVQRLLDEYGCEEYREGMENSLKRIGRRLGGEKYSELSRLLERWELESFTTELIKHYYDKLYYKEKNWNADRVISLEDYHQAEQELLRFIQEEDLNAMGRG